MYWCGVLVCGGQEYVATCVNEAVAIADKLMTLSVIESTSSTNTERFKPSCDSFYVLKVQYEPPLPVLLRYKLVVIVVEDLQWVDSGTLDMILAFLQEAEQEGPWDGGCMFLLSTRPASTFPAHLSSTRDKIVAERIVTVIELGALSEDEAEGVTCRLLEVDELDFALRKLVLTSCSGSPLFITELCQSLCSTRGVQKVSTSSGKSRAALKTTGKDGGLSTGPRSVAEMVAARIDTLESTASLVLKVAAVIGEKFTLNVLYAVFPVDVDEATLATHLNSLVSKNFLAVENPSAMMQGTLCFKFKHSLMSAAAYGMLLHSNRWKLHYRVAVVLTEQGDQSYMVLARHWVQVALGNPSAAEIADLGVGELMGMGQFIDASLYFNDGLEVLKRMADTPRRKCLEIGM
ncbi:unnamed protein product [Ectocarpus sp. CCAP 1310/34]|nr:unnamed protein product [Ectocarpus sp. CCAP 1310/34]